MNIKKFLAVCIMAVLCIGIFAGCGADKKNKVQTSGDTDKVIIYSNADKEAVESIKNTLNDNGFRGKYLIKTFGTDELGKKLLSEGTGTKADLVTMSTFYEKSAQKKNRMFMPLAFDMDTLDDYENYLGPIISEEGTLIVNKKLLKQENLPVPHSIKDLSAPVYKGHIAVPDIKYSSTAWLMVQALIDAYGDSETKTILKGIYKNAGDNIEKAGAEPLKLCKSGKVAIGFGLRHQVIDAKEDGLPIDFIDPYEGNFSLTESVAVVNKSNKTNPLAMQMAQCLVEKGRKSLQQFYPDPLYKGEKAEGKYQPTNPEVFGYPLTYELYREHVKLSESAK